MNTKRQRVVVTLVVALATLATTGFVSAEPGHRWAALVADVTTCEYVEAIYLSPSAPDALDESCVSDIVIESIVTEIESGLLDPAIGERLLSDIYEQRRSSDSGSVENLSSIGVNAGEGAFSSASSSAGRRANNIDWIVNYLELEEPEVNAAADRSARRDGDIDWIVNYLELEEPEVDASPGGSARRGGDIDWIINYIELEEPATDESLLARIRELSRGSWELYALDELEREESSGLPSPSASALEPSAGDAGWFASIREASMGSWELYTLDEFLSEVGDGVVSPSSSALERGASDAAWFASVREVSQGAWELYTFGEFVSEVGSGVVGR